MPVLALVSEAGALLNTGLWMRWGEWLTVE